MFVPKAVVEKVNGYVHAQAEEPRFKKGVGFIDRKSGNVLRYVSQTPQQGRRFTDVALAYFAAKDEKRARDKAAKVAKPSKTGDRSRVLHAARVARMAQAAKKASA